jgi:hypothetical protein
VFLIGFRRLAAATQQRVNDDGEGSELGSRRLAAHDR